MLNFLLYMVTALGLLAVFMLIYERFTPYRELHEIREGNVAAAIAFVGAILGFTFPLVSVIFYTHSILEMLFWGVITGVVQLALFAILQHTRSIGECIKKRNAASGILLAGLAMSIGLINAISISY
jgi:putative membrane protein